MEWAVIQKVKKRTEVVWVSLLLVHTLFKVYVSVIPVHQK